MPTINPLTQRVRVLRHRLGDKNADSLLVTNANDVRYLTGFVGCDSWAYVPLDRGRVYLISDFRYIEQIERDAPHAVAIIRKKSLAEAFAKLVDRRKARRILLQQDHVTLAQRQALAKLIGARRLRAVNDGLLDQRAVKDAGEVRLIRKALAIQTQAFNETRAFIKVGMSEIEICAYLEYRMRALGADGPSFDSIVAINANAALPHAMPSMKKVTKNCLIQFDWGARYNGYCSDLSRVVTVGRVKPKLREIYDIVLEAQEAAIAAVAPGMPYREIDAAARNVIKKAGYEKQFGHGTGHGIGLDIHERPIVSSASKSEAKPGEVITIEPGIYLPGIGGVRLEEDVLVTERGRQVLSGVSGVSGVSGGSGGSGGVRGF